jgi:hypothetical protein
VGHILVTTFRLVAFFLAPPFILAFIAMCASGDLLSSFATGVGQSSDAKDEEPLSKVRSADFSRREDSRLNCIAHSSKGGCDFLKPDADESRDVFKEAEVGTAFFHDSDEMRPQIAGVCLAKSLASDGDRLAWESANDSMNLSTPRAAVEGCEIRPNRRVIQGFLFHARSQDFAGEAFVLNAADCSSSWHRQAEPEIESPGSGTEAKNVDGT